MISKSLHAFHVPISKCLDCSGIDQLVVSLVRSQSSFARATAKPRISEESTAHCQQRVVYHLKAVRRTSVRTAMMVMVETPDELEPRSGFLTLSLSR